MPGERSAAKAAGGTQKTGKSTVDDAVIFTAGLTGGAIATFEATRLSTGHKNNNRLEIHGEKGALIWNFERMTELQWYDATLDDGVQGWSTIHVSNGDAGHPYAAAYWPTAHHIGYEHSFVNQAADMSSLIAGQEAVVPMPDFADAYETQRVLAAVTKSAKEQAVVPLSDVV